MHKNMKHVYFNIECAINYTSCEHQWLKCAKDNTGVVLQFLSLQPVSFCRDVLYLHAMNFFPVYVP